MKQKIQSLFNKSNIKNTLFNSVFFLVLLSSIYRFANQLLITHGYDSWAISEFLINYQGGFVRRGLLGEILFLFAQNFDINVEWTVKTCALICFFFVCLFFVKAFLKNGYTLYILPLCYFLGMGTFYSFWIRKDYLMILFFIVILWTYKSKLSTPIKIFLINILAIAIILIHESFAFFALPFLFLLFFNEYKKISISALLLLPSAITFLLTLSYHGDLKTVQTIWNSWVATGNFKVSRLDMFSHGSLSALSWPGKWTFIEHFKINFLTKDLNVLSAVFWCIAVPDVYYISSNALLVFRKNENAFTIKDKTNLSSILIFQLICLLPFFLALSCDLGRVLFYWTTSSFVIFLIIPKDKIEKIFPTFFVGFIERINIGLTHILSPTKTTIALLMLMLGIPIEGFSFQRAIETSLTYNSLWTLSYFLATLKKIVFMFF
jgi:hypothetical protein